MGVETHNSKGGILGPVTIFCRGCFQYFFLLVGDMRVKCAYATLWEMM